MLENPIASLNEPSTQKWKFSTAKDRFLIAGSSLTSVVIFGTSLLPLFTPTLLVAASVFSVGALALDLTPAWRNRKLAKEIKQNGWQLAPETEPVIQIVAETSRALGRARPPKVYLSRSKNDKLFGAILLGKDILLTTQAALDKAKDEQVLRFVVAHEMSHLHVDDKSPVVLARKLIDYAGLGISIAMIAAWVVPVFGLALAGTAAATGFMSIATPIAGALASIMTLHLGNRVMERRADKNALFVTNDLNGGEKALDLIDPSKGKKPSRFVELLLSHPSYTKRLTYLKQSFNAVAKYAPTSIKEKDASLESVGVKAAGNRPLTKAGDTASL